MFEDLSRCSNAVRQTTLWLMIWFPVPRQDTKQFEDLIRSSEERHTTLYVWRLSRQLHMVTSGRSISPIIHKQTYIWKLLSVNCANPFASQLHKVNPYTNIKQNIHTQTPSYTNFRRVGSFNTALVSKAYKARTCWYCQPFRLVYRHHNITSNRKE